VKKKFISKKQIDDAVRKLAKTTAAPLLPTRTRNFLKKEGERLEKEAKKRADIPTAAQIALKEAKERKRPVTIKPKGDQPLVLQVNAHVIKSNKVHGRNDPPLRVRHGRNGENPVHAHTLKLTGPSEIIHSPDKPLKCGARVWIETHHPVKAK
jgi:hypothetical protein